MTGKDIICVLPTGYGKSVIFQALPFLCSHDVIDTCDKVVVVVTPLNSLMLNQVTKLTQVEIKACWLNYSGKEGHGVELDADDDFNPVSCSVPMEEIRDGGYNVIYAHPESLLSEAGLDLMKAIRHRVCYLVVDEAHMLVEW